LEGVVRRIVEGVVRWILRGVVGRLGKEEGVRVDIMEDGAKHIVWGACDG
jgi:hypothetical protein